VDGLFRRLRATLSTFKKVVADDHLDSVKAGLKWLAKELDDARNLDVFIDGLADTELGGPELEETRKALQAARSTAYDRARAAAGAERTAALLLDILIWIETGPWSSRRSAADARNQAATLFGAAVLDKNRKRLIKSAKGLSDLRPEERHQARIRAKRLRYAADVLVQLFPEHPRRARKFLDALQTLIGTLGDLNDMATAHVIAPQFAHAPQLLAGEEKREAELLSCAEAALACFGSAKSFWGR
jgi:inorganic triphosphatase YgiF